MTIDQQESEWYFTPLSTQHVSITFFPTWIYNMIEIHSGEASQPRDFVARSVAARCHTVLWSSLHSHLRNYGCVFFGKCKNEFLSFSGFRGRKKREIRNWICSLGNLSQTRAICMTSVFWLFDKLSVLTFVVGGSNSDDQERIPHSLLRWWNINRSRKKHVKVENYLQVVTSVWSSFGFLM